MIPSYQEAVLLWERYALPQKKQLHCTLVTKLALYIASAYQDHGIKVNTNLLRAAALLHDIDKRVSGNKEERHPDTAVRMLQELHMEEVAALVKTHPLHAILDHTIYPTALEGKILFLSDKMVKYEIVGVDERFALWQKESLSQEERSVLEHAYPKVKQLEQEVLGSIGLTEEQVITQVKKYILQEGGVSL